MDCRAAAPLAMTKKTDYMAPMLDDPTTKRLRWRAHHRGTKEADLMLGGFFDRHADTWDDAGIDWFEALLEEQDVDIMGWAIGSIACPPEWESEMMGAMRKLGYVPLPS